MSTIRYNSHTIITNKNFRVRNFKGLGWCIICMNPETCKWLKLSRVYPCQATAELEAENMIQDMKALARKPTPRRTHKYIKA